jgi:co-chaperonin GroES (HSP10)
MGELLPEGVKCLVKPDAVLDKTEGGIILPDSTKEDEKNATTKGTVLAIGPNADVVFEDGPLDIGDHIIYARYGGVLIERDDGDVRCINDEDVIAKIN